MLRSHWSWFALGVLLLSGFDYWDHISRPDSPFSHFAARWLAFTAASSLTVLVIPPLASFLLQRLGSPELLASTVGVGGTVALHVLFTGPLWSQLFWTGGTMKFASPLAPVALACCLYLAFRSAHFVGLGLVGRLAAQRTG